MDEFNNTKFESADMCFAGDSLIARGLFNEFFPNSRVANRGIGGDVTEGLMKRINQIAVLHPKVVVIMIGINDIYQSFEKDIIVDNIRKTCQRLKEQEPTVKIYLCSILPTQNQKKLDKIIEVNASYKKLCVQENISYVDLYDSFLGNDGYPAPALYCDEVHLSGDGYNVLVNAVKAELREL